MEKNADEYEVAVVGAPVRVWKFKVSGCDTVWSIPLMGSLPMKYALSLRGLADASTDKQIDAAIELFDKLCPGLTDVVSVDQLTEIVNGWRRESGISLGESQASSEQ